MKPLRGFYTVLFLSFVSVPGICQIAGTAHDFSGKSWAPMDNKICGVCHTTHNAMDVPSAPLWTHQVTSVASYTLLKMIICAWGK